MELSQIITVDKKFQTSVNLEYDLYSFDKIEGYIPTEQSVAVLNKFLQTIYYPSENKHANVLVGPYGRGKSHLLLVLSSLLSLDIVSESKTKAKKVLKSLIEKISRVDNKVGALAEEIFENKIRLLPIIINSNGIDINQNLILAMRDALERANLLDILPSTHFDAALSVLKMWEESYPEAYHKFNDELKLRKVDINTFDVRLGQFDVSAYEVFCEIYPKVAAGTNFNPYANTDIIKLYTSVNEALKKKSSFKGIFIIFDEFSKFVESNLDKTRMHNFKIIQDLAEKSERESSLLFTCVTHKALIDYSTSDSFKTVEGRFGTINFVASSEQSYELIANAIIKGQDFKEFQNKYKDNFEQLINASSMTGLFSEIEEGAFRKKLIYGCFPIAPLTAYTLLRVSEKVGQNERTVFTFLAQNGEGTLVEFLEHNHGFALMTVDYVFDYFKEQFRKSVFNNKIHSMWAKAESALYQIDDADAQKIIKALAVFGIVADERLKPISSHIKAALDFDEQRFTNAINKLVDRTIIAQRETSEYVLLTANGVDVQNNVKNYINTKTAKIDKIKILDELLETKYLLPRQYNDEFSMIRFLKVKFIEAAVFTRTMHWQQLVSHEEADGVLLNVLINSDKERKAVENHIQIFQNQQHIIICVPQQDGFDELLIKQLDAVRQLKLSESAKSDKHYYEELEVFEEDVQKRLVNAIHLLYSPDSEYSRFYNCEGELSDIRRQVKLNKEVSKICKTIYCDSPKINNELINKNNISAPIKKASSLIIKHILENSDKTVIPEMTGYGPEASIFNSVFVATELNKTEDVQDQGLCRVIGVITHFIREAEQHKKDFTELYNILLNPPYGVRKGILPLLITYALRTYKEKVIIYFSNNEVQLSANVLEAINNSNGENYQLLLEMGTQLRDDSINELYQLFNTYSDAQSRSINRIYNTVKCMQNWMRSLPEFTKKCSGIYTEEKFIPLDTQEGSIRRELLKFEINSRDFLFDLIFTDNSDNGYRAALRKIANFKEKLDSHINGVNAYLANITKDILVPNYKGSLGSTIIVWKKSLSEATCRHMFDSTTNQILNYLLQFNNYDENKIIFELCRIITGIDLADWNDSTIDKYKDTLANSIKKIADYESSDSTTNSDNGIELTFNGVKVSKTFSTLEPSPIGQTVLNSIESSLEEYGDSISPDEKLAILFNIIKGIIN